MLEPRENEDRGHVNQAPSQQELLSRVQRIGDKNIRDGDITKLGKVIGGNLPFLLETSEELRIALGTERLDATERHAIARILDEIAERVALETGSTMPNLQVPPELRKPEKPN